MTRDGIPRQEIRHMLQGTVNPVIVEVGANDGNDTSLFLEHLGDMPGIHIHAFEPDPRAAKRWLSTMSRQKGRDKVTFYQQAVSNENGYADFRVCRGAHPAYNWYGDWDKASSLMAPNEEFKKSWPYLNMDHVISVPVITLDTWSTKHSIDKVDFMWVDVEGATHRLIEGAKELLKRTRYLFTETTIVPRFEGELVMDDIVKLLADTFDVVEVFDNDVLFSNHILAGQQQ